MEDRSLILSILHWVVSAIALLITAYVIRGFKVKSFFSAMIAAVVVGFFNILLRPLLLFLTLPLNLLTLGLFTFVVDAIVLRLSAALLPGFEIDSWIAAVFGAVILALVGTGLHLIFV